MLVILIYISNDVLMIIPDLQKSTSAVVAEVLSVEIWQLPQGDIELGPNGVLLSDPNWE